MFNLRVLGGLSASLVVIATGPARAAGFPRKSDAMGTSRTLALRIMLRELKSRGYRIVHVEAATKTATLPFEWLAPKKAMHYTRTTLV